MKITLPLPPASVSAHNKGHWRSKSSAVKKCREHAMLLARAQRAKAMERARLTVSFFFPDNIARDAANFLQMCKPYVDGVVDAGVIPDDRWQVMELAGVRCAIDRENPRVELLFEDATGEKRPGGEAVVEIREVGK